MKALITLLALTSTLYAGMANALWNPYDIASYVNPWGYESYTQDSNFTEAAYSVKKSGRMGKVFVIGFCQNHKTFYLAMNSTGSIDVGKYGVVYNYGTGTQETYSKGWRNLGDGQTLVANLSTSIQIAKKMLRHQTFRVVMTHGEDHNIYDFELNNMRATLGKVMASCGINPDSE